MVAGMNDEQDDIGKYTLNESQRRAVRDLFATLPNSYEDRFAALRALRHAFHQNMATAYEPALRRQVHAQPKGETADRATLVVMIDQSLQALGLSLADPTTGHRANLILDESDFKKSRPWPFQLIVHDDAGGRTSSAPSDELPTIHIVEADRGPDKLISEWRQSNKGGPGR